MLPLLIGNRSANCALTDAKALQIYHAKGTNVEIAREFGISDAQVGNIKRGKSWAHVTGHKTGAAE